MPWKHSEGPVTLGLREDFPEETATNLSLEGGNSIEKYGRSHREVVWGFRIKGRKGRRHGRVCEHVRVHVSVCV